MVTFTQLKPFAVSEAMREFERVRMGSRAPTSVGTWRRNFQAGCVTLKFQSLPFVLGSPVESPRG